MRRYVLGALTNCPLLVFALAGAALAGGGSEEAPAAAEQAASGLAPAGRIIWDATRIPDREKTRLEFPDLIRFRGQRWQLRASHLSAGKSQGKLGTPPLVAGGPARKVAGPDRAPLRGESPASQESRTRLCVFSSFACVLLLQDLSRDKPVKVEAFRTEQMKEGHYVACKLMYGEQTVTLRDETLQPVWAMGRGKGGGRGWYGGGLGRGPNAASGPGWGRG